MCFFILANSADPDEMARFVAVHLGLHIFAKALTKESLWYTKG